MATLLEQMKLIGDGFDIGDDVYDFGTYFGCEYEKPEDYYDKCLTLIASEIELVKYQPKWFSTCKITDFIKKHQTKIDKWLNENFVEDWTPKHFQKEYGVKKLTDDNEIFYELYIVEFFEKLCVGAFSEADYKEIYELLGGK